MKYSYVESPLGDLMVIHDGHGLIGLRLPTEKRPIQIGPEWERDDAPFGELHNQLDEYFAGERREFELDLRAKGNAFQKAVWQELRQIPYGMTASYGEVASEIGKPGAARAVGIANAQNPIAIITPCHRVIGADGSLTGYGGGLEAKRWLLDHEGQYSNSAAQLFIPAH
jgi:methylated-DNA-[protein]-cysteine S-methyltransferase